MAKAPANRPTARISGPPAKAEGLEAYSTPMPANPMPLPPVAPLPPAAGGPAASPRVAVRPHSASWHRAAGNWPNLVILPVFPATHYRAGSCEGIYPN
jgi:hypothetical protein